MAKRRGNSVSAMVDIDTHKANIASNGYTIYNDVFNNEQLDAIIDVLTNIDTSRPTFRKTIDLFAIRQFLKEVPQVKQLLFADGLTKIITELFGNNYFIAKSIYFDKPEESNWFVAYHQDLTISVDRKLQVPGYGPWTIKHNQFAVQPPLSILQDNFTVRIHLDNTDEHNGALKVIKGSQLKQVYRPETIDWTTEIERVCPVNKGGIMIMRPLLLHASNRTTNNKKRRVIHIEFSKAQLPAGLHWSEKEKL